LPSNYVSRLDLSRLNGLKRDNGRCVFREAAEQVAVSEEFLYTLLNKASFSFDIDFWDLSLQNLEEEQAKQLKYLAKRLDSIYYQTVDNFLEYGLKTFGFGFPLIIKRDRKDKSKIIKAPLLIWKLEIEKSNKTPNNWTIKKEDDFPIAMNEILVSQIYSDDSIKLEDIPQEYLEDSIIQKEELISLCNTVLNQVNRNDNANETLKLEKCPTAQKIAETASAETFIHWSGVFGTYKNQKQSLIKELEILEENFDEFENGEPPQLQFESKVSGVDTDPSQERIVNNFADSHLKIIQGPPGTGKSQTISAIITNALENQKKCLVICEKKTAIQVIYNNLSKIGFGSFCAVIDDINRDRYQIINSARSKIENYSPGRFSSHIYQLKLEKYEHLKEKINKNIAQLTKPCFGDYNHKELVGLFLENLVQLDFQLLKIDINPGDFKFSYAEYQELQELVDKTCKLSDEAKAQTSGLHIIKDDIFLLETTEQQRYEIQEQLNQLFSDLDQLEKTLEFTFLNVDEIYDYSKIFLNLKTKTEGLFNKKISTEFERKKEVWKAYINLNSTWQYIDFLKEKLAYYDDFKSYPFLQKYVIGLKEKVKKCIDDYGYFWQFQKWKRYFNSNSEHVQKLIAAIESQEPEKRMNAFKSWYLNQKLGIIYHEEGLEEVEGDLSQLIEIQAELKQLQYNKITNYWKDRQNESVEKYQKEKGNIKRLYNFRQNKEFGRKNALRKIIATDFELFSDLFPVILTNPVACSSVLPMKSNLFDIVIFDEASQLRIEDTYASYLRGAYKVISGDRHQMPPSSYFQSGQSIAIEGEITEEIEESAFMAESESLLEFAEENTIRQTYLEFHYRSRHPWLIDFSNAAFYGSRLIPMPAVKEYKPIHFKSVEGLYSEGINVPEADAVVDILANQIEPIDNGEMPSVGVATTNIAQRNLIWDRISKRRFEDPEFSKKMASLNNNGFFVKNLENIQGDERDIIIMATTFGPDEEGNFRQNFGPLNQTDGYRLLNVIITRAKYQVYVCSSIPTPMFSNYKKLIEENGNNGRGIFYAYLAYALAIEQGNETERQNILNYIAKHCKESNLGTQNKHIAGPFENILKDQLGKTIDNENIMPIFQFGGFYLDMLVALKNQSNVALECNGGHDIVADEAYSHLQYRQKLLQNYGYKYVHLWSLDFWKKPEKSLNRLKITLDQN
jgi:superfamily I DNA and/or RNA helicase